MEAMPDQFTRQACAKSTVFVGDGFLDAKRLTGSTRGKGRLYPRIVDVGVIAGSAIALALPAYMAVASRGQQGAEVEFAGGAHLFQQIGASDSSFQRGQAERREQGLYVAR